MCVYKGTCLCVFVCVTNDLSIPFERFKAALSLTQSTFKTYHVKCIYKESNFYLYMCLLFKSYELVSEFNLITLIFCVNHIIYANRLTKSYVFAIRLELNNVSSSNTTENEIKITYRGFMAGRIACMFKRTISDTSTGLALPCISRFSQNVAIGISDISEYSDQAFVLIFLYL